MYTPINTKNIAVLEHRKSQFGNYFRSVNVILHTRSLYASTEPLSPAWNLGPSARAVCSELLRDNAKTQRTAL